MIIITHLLSHFFFSVPFHQLNKSPELLSLSSSAPPHSLSPMIHRGCIHQLLLSGKMAVVDEGALSADNAPVVPVTTPVAASAYSCVSETDLGNTDSLRSIALSVNILPLH